MQRTLNCRQSVCMSITEAVDGKRIEHNKLLKLSNSVLLVWSFRQICTQNHLCHWSAIDELKWVTAFVNKKVLLRERKRHTARRVASARYADLSRGGTPSHVRGVPRPMSGRGGTPSHVRGGGYPVPCPVVRTYADGKKFSYLLLLNEFWTWIRWSGHPLFVLPPLDPCTSYHIFLNFSGTLLFLQN